MKNHKQNNFKNKDYLKNKLNIKRIEINKFIELKTKQSVSIFEKSFLTYTMAYNVLFFCSKYWDLSNISKVIRPVLIYLNSTIKFFFKTSFAYLSKFFFLNVLKKKIFFLKHLKLIKSINNFRLSNIFFLKNFLKNRTKNKKINKTRSKIKQNEKDLETKPLVNVFLMLRSTWNNFFVTVIDSKGRTLITWTGGMGERTASKVKSSVFSADSAVYEACFMAKKWGVEALTIHIWTTFWLPQIWNSFDGLEASGLQINELVYWPKVSYGGCWKKKPRWV